MAQLYEHGDVRVMKLIEQPLGHANVWSQLDSEKYVISQLCEWAKLVRCGGK